MAFGVQGGGVGAFGLRGLWASRLGRCRTLRWASIAYGGAVSRWDLSGLGAFEGLK